MTTCASGTLVGQVDFFQLPYLSILSRADRSRCAYVGRLLAMLLDPKPVLDLGHDSTVSRAAMGLLRPVSGATLAPIAALEPGSATPLHQPQSLELLRPPQERWRARCRYCSFSILFTHTEAWIQSVRLKNYQFWKDRHQISANPHSVEFFGGLFFMFTSFPYPIAAPTVPGATAAPGATLAPVATLAPEGTQAPASTLAPAATVAPAGTSSTQFPPLWWVSPFNRISEASTCVCLCSVTGVWAVSSCPALFSRASIIAWWPWRKPAYQDTLR